MTSQRVLIVEDDQPTATTVALYFRHAGFEVVVAHSGSDALAQVGGQVFDLVLLDIMLPGIDGWTLCRRVRRQSDAGIILVSALSTLDNRVEGLETGADDYVTKPFSPRELVARARAVLRRRSGRSQRVLQHDDLTLDRDRASVAQGVRALELTPSEFRLLEALLAAPGRLFTRAELIDRVEGECSDRTIDSHVANLRRKLGEEPRRYIETVFGRGYRLRAAGSAEEG